MTETITSRIALHGLFGGNCRVLMRPLFLVFAALHGLVEVQTAQIMEQWIPVSRGLYIFAINPPHECRCILSTVNSSDRQLYRSATTV